MSTEQKVEYSEVYLGNFGKFLPFITLLVTIVILTALGMGSIQNYWCAGFFAMAAGFLVYKDKSKFMKAVIDGARDPSLAFVIVMLIICCTFSQVMRNSGLAEALIMVLDKMNVSPKLLPAFAFVFAAFMSTATGSSVASLFTCLPVLLPLCQPLGIHAGLMAAAISCGGVFGDNLAPISDTTIISVSSVGADIGKAVRSRVKYSMAAAIPALVLYIVFGMKLQGTGAASAALGGGSAIGLVFLILPILTFVLIVKKVDMITTLLTGCLLGMVMLVVMGKASVASLFATDGVIVTGISGIVNSFVFMIMIYIIVNIIKDVGCLEVAINAIGKAAKGARSAEVVAGLMICGILCITTTATATLTMSGPMVSKLLEPYNISKERMSNFIDGFACAGSNILFYSANMISTIAFLPSFGAPADITLMDYYPYLFFSFLLIIVYWFAIISGWGRTFMNDVPDAA